MQGRVGVHGSMRRGVAGGPRGRKSVALAVKRVVDVLGALGGLVVLAPVLGATALAILVTDGQPVFFRHVRPGRFGRPFTLIKFRTMRPLRDGERAYDREVRRVTRLGRFLRVTSLDELPELWNVLRGEMSLVGPRPLLVEYLEAYTPEERRRHDVRPGITGWAAVNGRHGLRFRDRLKLDVWYVDHWSLALDFRILARTVVHVVRRSGVAVTEDSADLGFPLPAPAGPAGEASEKEPRRNECRHL
jgi:lipopolysaccharide/colanic/teichoic acid biosynthesis glycosyltransferase